MTLPYVGVPSRNNSATRIPVLNTGFVRNVSLFIFLPLAVPVPTFRACIQSLDRHLLAVSLADILCFAVESVNCTKGQIKAGYCEVRAIRKVRTQPNHDASSSKQFLASLDSSQFHPAEFAWRQLFKNFHSTPSVLFLGRRSNMLTITFAQILFSPPYRKSGSSRRTIVSAIRRPC